MEGADPPACSTTQFGQVAERSKAADCKSAGPCGLRRFEPSPVHQVRENRRGCDGQAERAAIFEGPETRGGSNSVVESQPSKLLVAGSIPVSRSRKPMTDAGIRMAKRGRCSSVGRARPW